VTPFDTAKRPSLRAPSPGTLGVAAATGLVLFEVIETVVGTHGLGTTLAAGWAQLVAPGFVALVLFQPFRAG
jgi:hypothetical protein